MIMEAFFNIFRFGAICGEIRVWNWRGHVYLFSEELEEKGEVIRAEGDWGTFQIPKSVWEFLDDKERRNLLKSLSNWLLKVLEDNGGAITWSGIYCIHEVHAEKYMEIINRYVLRALNKSKIDLSVIGNMF